MLDNPLGEEVAVDRREEVVSTEQPGYRSTQRVTQDVAGGRRLQLFQINRVLFMALGILELMLGLRFILKLMAANPSNGFASFVYGLTGAFTKPFDALLGTPAIDGQIFEVTTLIAMCVYALVFGLVGKMILLIGDRPRVRTSARSVQEQTPNTAAVISADRIDPPAIVSAAKLPDAAPAYTKDPLFQAYSKFIRRQQHLITLKAHSLRARLKAPVLPTAMTVIILERAEQPDPAEIINVEQLPDDVSRAQIIRADPAEIINVEQLPDDVLLDQIIRADSAEIINVEQLPDDVSLDQIDHADRLRIIRLVKLPLVVDAAKKGPWLQAYRELVYRHRPSIGLPTPVISAN